MTSWNGSRVVNRLNRIYSFQQGLSVFTQKTFLREREKEGGKKEGKERRKDNKKRFFGCSSFECDIFVETIYVETKVDDTGLEKSEKGKRGKRSSCDAGL